MMYLDWTAIRTARQELGLPTDNTALENLEIDLQERLSDLVGSIHGKAERTWFSQNPGQLIPSDVTISLHQQALRAAVVQIMEDEVNEPMRQLLIQREEEAELQRQGLLDAS